MPEQSDRKPFLGVLSTHMLAHGLGHVIGVILLAGLILVFNIATSSPAGKVVPPKECPYYPPLHFAMDDEKMMSRLLTWL